MRKPKYIISTHVGEDGRMWKSNLNGCCASYWKDAIRFSSYDEASKHTRNLGRPYGDSIHMVMGQNVVRVRVN